MSYYISVRVRRPYFDAIVQGEKTVEVRRVSPFWTHRVLRALEAIKHWGRGGQVYLTFLCGRRTHRRKLLWISIHPDARSALGREPSKQGRKDLGDGPVYAFHLGEVATNTRHQARAVEP